ncbi:alpha/beta fold hydrolase [Microbacterium sp. NPDC055683]
MTIPPIALTAPVGPADAPLVVLGPSLGTSTIVWESVVPLLSARFRVVCWDLPGHGAARPATEAFEVGDLADAVAAAVGEPFLYAGVSLGGATGLELLLRHPDLVPRAAIVCASPRFADAQTWTDRAAQVRAQGTPVLVSASAGRWFDSIARIPVLSGRLLHALSDADDESYALCCEALSRWDVTGRLGGIAAPVLAIAGVHDPVSPPAHAEAIAAGVVDGLAVVVPEASHLAPAEQPAAVAEQLIRHFEGIAR